MAAIRGSGGVEPQQLRVARRTAVGSQRRRLATTAA